MKYNLNKLNCMNYEVATSEDSYYLQCGLRSLWRFSKRHNIDFKSLCITLLDKGYLLLSDNDTQIEMI